MKTDSETVMFPIAPEELWLLRINDSGVFVRAMDCAGDPMLVYASEADAKAGAVAHSVMWEIECTPFRIR